MNHTSVAKHAMPRIEAFQICYSAESAQSVPAGFKALNNLDNARADWREYWPIREYLLNNPLEDGVLYGFVSPKFSYKTGLDYQAVQSFVEKQYQGEDTASLRRTKLIDPEDFPLLVEINLYGRNKIGIMSMIPINALSVKLLVSNCGFPHTTTGNPLPIISSHPVYLGIFICITYRALT